MHKVLVIGAGRSSSSLIQYLIQHAKSGFLQLGVADLDRSLAASHFSDNREGLVHTLDVSDQSALNEVINKYDLVVSMLPAYMHTKIAKVCVELSKHLFTASYVSDEMLGLQEEVKHKGLLFLNECGLDPGLDHMTAMESIDEIKSLGGEIVGFKSYTGGLISPESCNNSWKYKFTWNPRNVVLAGQGTARFIRNGKMKFIPYHRLFSRYESLNIDGIGQMEGYPNRDSLSYREKYGLVECPTVIRGTIRYSGFCKGWDLLVQLGLTDDSFRFQWKKGTTQRDFTNMFLPYDAEMSVEDKLCRYLNIDREDEGFRQLEEIGLFSNQLIANTFASPAEVLQDTLEKKWQLEPTDIDMIVMQHRIQYELKDTQYLRISEFLHKGKSHRLTAMADTVGLPLGVAIYLFFKGAFKETGINIPTQPHFYKPILEELEKYGFQFSHREHTITDTVL
ncbi:MAG: saccharopine dehydrogenase NADP-binding domain-containing protein [Cyclobacteriaceae bacterium]|nr:saccharopine dehydrogenase NADP-binding domain-containing protein [Cyclobacteriaceae bacterium]